MAIARYPNRDALQEGADVYTSHMRRVITGCLLRNKQEMRLADAVEGSLSDYQKDHFRSALQESGDVLESIDFGHIPNLIRHNSEALKTEFPMIGRIRNRAFVIRDIRNEAFHESVKRDIPQGMSETALYLMADVLSYIRERQGQQDIWAVISKIRLPVATAAQVAPDVPPEPASNGDSAEPEPPKPLTYRDMLRSQL